MIFIREEILPVLVSRGMSDLGPSLVPTFNIIRFYEALPVVQLGHRSQHRK